MVSFKATRLGPWQWAVSFMLLLATMINYMDRQTLSNLAPRIKDYFALTQQQYGELEFTFGVAFAVGSLVFGALADVIPVRWLYPGVLLAWSAVGFVTGLSDGFDSLFWCRTLLGFFEAGHWPCALVVTHAILTGSDRALGNSILQSGASLGAIITPLIITALVAGIEPATDAAEAWRTPFLVIGSVGVLWAVLWIAIVKPDSIRRPQATLSGTSTSPHSSLAWVVETIVDRRFWALVVMVVCINGTWQLIRAWLTMFLQKGKGYPETTTLLFNSTYYIATDVGCLLAGAAALWLVRCGLTVHRSRLLVYGCCAGLSALTCVAAILPASPVLLAVLLIVGAGTLGLFPCYYSFTQEINPTRVGKMTGILSCLGWLISAPIHPIFGRYVDQTGSFDLGIALVGLAPLMGLFAMLLLWPSQPEESELVSQSE